MKGKKFLALVMAAAMTMSLAACGDNADNNQSSGSTPGSESTPGSNEETKDTQDPQMPVA